MPTRKGHRSIGGLVVGYGIAGLAAALFVFVRMVTRALGLPIITAAVIWAICAVAGMGWLLWWFVRWVRSNRTLPKNFTKSDERYRVRCVGSPERLEELDRLGPIEDTPFEPEEFLGFLILPPRPAMVVVWVVVAVVIAAAAFGLPLGFPPGGAIFVFYGAFAAGGLAITLIWPTRIRVIPGRVDITRSLFLRPGKGERRTLTLRTSTLLVDLRKWQAFITGPTPQTSIYVWMWPVPGRMELAHALLNAAVSTARPGPLTDDAAA
jgi:hypothetical protein